VRHLVSNGTVSVSALAPSWYINGMNPSLQVVVGGGGLRWRMGRKSGKGGLGEGCHTRRRCC